MVKIIIIGAGISGLSSYLFLRKHLLLASPSLHDHEIKIYEAYDIHQSTFNGSSITVSSQDTDDPRPSDDTEPEFTPQAIGSAIGISKNGINVLSRLDNVEPKPVGAPGPTIVQLMALHGHPIERWQLSSARGFTLVSMDLAPPASETDKSNKTKSSLLPNTADSDQQAKDSSPLHTIMIARQACWEILRDRVLAVAPDVVIHKKIANVVIGDASTMNTVVFEDGTCEEADLVIGADGLRSVLRRAMFSHAKEDDGASEIVSESTKVANEKSWLRQALAYLPLTKPRITTTEKTDFISPHYEGLVGVGGFVPSSILQATGHKAGTMSIVFGPNGFFGYGYLTSSTPSTHNPEATTTTTTVSKAPKLLPSPGPFAGWWSTFSSPNPHPYSHSHIHTTSKFNKPLALTALLRRHSRWQNPSIAAILSHTQHDTLHHGPAGKALDAAYPTWTTPPLPYWSLNGRVVLIGDAAHALQPSSGQGASQGLEDAESLALFLSYYLLHSPSPYPSPSSSPTHAALARALASHQSLRLPRVSMIHTYSQRMSRMKADMSVAEEWMMYFFIWMGSWGWLMWVLKKVGADDMARYHEVVGGYDLVREVGRVIAKEERDREGGEGYAKVKGKGRN